MDWNLSTAARTLFQEARGEPLDGKQAVAATIVNSLRTGRWGDTLASVCLWHGRFSGWWCPRTVAGKAFHDPNFAAACHLRDDDPVLVAMAGLVSAALNGEDPTGGATHYFAKSIPAPAWVAGDPARGIRAATPCGQFGHQLFFKDVP
jgi:N-acetylmuramoyl-L-alanine amidase